MAQMYTYVNPSGLQKTGTQKLSDIEIRIFGRRKRDMDGKECKIIFIE
jgi:hypothetical protein